MALAETILRKIHKVGLIPKATKSIPRISLFLTFLSLAWLFYLPLDGNYRNTYISENALMPSQATSYFRESEWNIVRGYRTEVKGMEDESIESKSKKVEDLLRRIGMLTAYHKNHKTNDTLYAIMHAPRGDDTEAMVMAVPWFTSDDEYNEGGIALALALARYFNRLSIWSKNIIIVFPENGHFPLRSWVEAYHTSLEKTAGSIEAAIVVEYGKNGDHFDSYEMSYEGLNGQLPNLDLLNTANLVAYHEGLKCSLSSTPRGGVEKNTYSTRLQTLFNGILNLSLAGLRKNTPGCEAFSGWQIQSFTIKAKGNSGGNDVTQFGRLVDQTFRSVNNLLEKFHQSFFFYLLLSPRNFVSIGTYLPAAILVVASFALSSLGCFLNGKVSVESLTKDAGKLIAIFTTIESFCFILSVGLPYIILNSSSEEKTAKVLLYGFLASDALLAIMNISKINGGIKLSKTLTYTTISLYLFIISMLITTLLIVHFSLALLIGILSLPLTFVQPIISKELETRRGNLNKISKRSLLKISICLLISNPFFAVYIYGVSNSSGIDGVQLMRGLLTSWEELQCWTWFVVIIGWLPSWIAVSLCCVFGVFSEAETPDTKKTE